MAIHAVYATGGGGMLFSNAINLRGNTPDTAASGTWLAAPEWVSATCDGKTATSLPADPTTRGWYTFSQWSSALSLATAKASGLSVAMVITDGDANALDEELSLSFSAAAHAEVTDGAAFAGLEIDCEFSGGVLSIYRARMMWDSDGIRGRRYMSSVIAPSPLVRL